MYRIIVSEHFKRQLKKLVKKNRSLKQEFRDELSCFNKSSCVSLGMGLWKLRLKGEARGKSGGYRLIVFLMEIDGVISPVCIYSKSVFDNVSEKDLLYHVRLVKAELDELL